MANAAKVEEVFSKAEHVVSLDIVSQRLIPSAMEPRSTIAEIDKKSGRLLLHVQSQDPGFDPRRAGGSDPEAARRKSVRVLGRRYRRRLRPRRPMSIRKTASSPTRRVKLNRKIRLARRPHRRFRRRHPWPRPHFDRRVRARCQGPRAGLSRAFRSAGTGAYMGGAPATSFPLVLGPFVQTGVYDLPLVHFEVKTVMTNTAPVGAYRGAGRPEAVFIVERLFDAAARQIGMDPAARSAKPTTSSRRNCPIPTPPAKCTTVARFAHMLERAAKLADWGRLQRAPKREAKEEGPCSMAGA